MKANWMLDARCWMPDETTSGQFMSYKNLDIWNLSRELVGLIHQMTIEKLPAFEKYEGASQIRRSIKSVRSNIVEGYGRRRYKQEFIRFLTYALASCDETADHLESLHETRSLTDRNSYQEISGKLKMLGKKLNSFIQAVEEGHRVGKPASSGSSITHPASSIQDRASTG